MQTPNTQEMSPDFLNCWKAAGIHLNRQADSGTLPWLRAHPYPPYFEHLSFRLGNQLFLVRVEDADGKVAGPGTRQVLQEVAQECRGHACLMPMRRRSPAGEWVAAETGWGLLHADSMKPFNPIDLVNDEKIEMTPWELHDFAVQTVRDLLEKEGRQVMYCHGNPEMDPSIWFSGASKKPEWVVVRSTRFPEKFAKRPGNLKEIAKYCEHMSKIGHFASVAVASTDSFEAGKPQPLYRGHGFYVRYTGLEPL